MGLLSSIGTAVGGFFGGPAGAAVAGGALSLIGGERANSAQAAMSQEQMDFQERMSNTAYQRAMVDMRKAGLNPILAGKLGGASTPGGSMPILHDTITPAVNTAMNVMNTNADTKVKEEQINKIAQEVSNLKAAQNLTTEQTRQVGFVIDNLNQQINESRARTSGIDADNIQKEILSGFFSSHEFALIAKEMGVDAGTVVDVIKSFFSVRKKGATSSKIINRIFSK